MNPLFFQKTPPINLIQYLNAEIDKAQATLQAFQARFADDPADGLRMISQVFPATGRRKVFKAALESLKRHFVDGINARAEHREYFDSQAIFAKSQALMVVSPAQQMSDILLLDAQKQAYQELEALYTMVALDPA